ncbi:MAG: zinc-dependent alcohol dehydrogenase [Nitriliruptoraceae bacterium]
MRALVCEEFGQVVVRDVAEPSVQDPTDVVVRVTTTTVCGSDVGLVHGHIPTEPGFVLGHEYVGVVEEVGGAVSRVQPGQRVVGPAAPYCGTCATCARGQIQRCERGGVLGSGAPWGGHGGTQAERLRVPHADRDLVPVPDGLSDEQVLFAGDILPTGWSAVRWADTTPGDTLVVLGAGPVGLAAVLTAKLHGPRAVIVVDPIEGRRQLAATLGASLTLDPTRDDVAAAVAEHTRDGADGVVEAAGRADTIVQATQLVRVGGSVAIVGIPPGPVELPIADLLMRNITLRQGLGYLGDMDRLVALIAAGRLDATPLITHRYASDQLAEAFHTFEHQQDGIVKPAITMSQPPQV